MLLYSQTHLHNLLDRLETSDARTTGQLEALTVWVAALVGTADAPAHLAISAPRCGGSSRSRRPLRSLAGKPQGLTVWVTKAR